jgi:hypothetical protein
MHRNELTAAAAAELAALDAILAGEPVAEEHLELAALVDSVRRTSPTVSEAGLARIDARIGRKASAARTGGGSTSRRARAGRGWSPGRPRVAFAGGTVVAVVVALAVVLSSGVLGGSKTPAAPSVAPRADHVGGAAGLGSARAPSFAASGATTSSGVIAPPAKSTGPAAQRNVNPTNRLVARGASLTLASAPDQMQSVANEVVADTQQLGGIVEGSNVAVHGVSSYASFSLSVPSARLDRLLAALSSLANVRSLDQSTSDITDSYDQATTQLADERAQRASLIKALAAAATLTEEQTIQQKINRLDSAIAASAQHVGALLTRGHNASVSVQIVAASAGAVGGGGGPVNRALNDALAVLDVVLAIALVVLAIVIPIGLVALGLWWATAALRQRSRERVLDAPAS